MDGQKLVRNLESHSSAILCSATGCLFPSVWTSDPQRLGQCMVLKHFTTNTQSGSTTSKRTDVSSSSLWKPENSYSKNYNW